MATLQATLPGALAATLLLAGCATGPAPSDRLPAPQRELWAGLQALCGQAFEGEVREAPPGDSSFAGVSLVMHVRECDDDVIRIPFHVGDDRSRTWIVSRAADGLRLKHDHRHEDGSEDEITQYGGDTAGPGSATRQEFPADAHTTGLIPAPPAPWGAAPRP
ncbi:MAG: hypothetical protein KY466_04660 [Gemmatimonadetes bacterium]|nr:hypothetical protein [Gemmatimonadota bacterium]